MLFQGDLQCTEQHRKECKNITSALSVLSTHQTMWHYSHHTISDIFLPAWEIFSACLSHSQMMRAKKNYCRETKGNFHKTSKYHLCPKSSTCCIKIVGEDPQWLYSVFYFPAVCLSKLLLSITSTSHNPHKHITQDRESFREEHAKKLLQGATS